MCVWQGPDWAWGHVQIEALLSCRTVLGKHQDVEHLCQEAMTTLEDGLTRLNNMANAVKKLKKCISEVQSFGVQISASLSCYYCAVDFVQSFVQASQQSA
jgi:hypothetical protein